jgi:ABC-2 type transport system permease protein
MIAMPVVFAIVFILIGIANRTPSTSLESLSNDIKNVAIVDQSGLVSNDIAKASGQTLFPASDIDSLKQSVEKGERKGLVVFPQNVASTRQFDVYLSGIDLGFNSTVTTAANALLRASLLAPLGSQEKATLALEGANATTTTYDNGVASVGFDRFIAPGLVTALFFIILFFSIGYILTSIADEKENRSIEMALTYLSPRTLITGKLIAITLITLTQIAFFGALAIIGLLIVNQTEFIQLPTGFDISSLPIDPFTISIALAIVIVGFILFASTMALIASLLPAKQANSFSGLFYILPFLPFWFMNAVLTDPNNSVVQFITYFPITAPTTVLIRNTLGNISPNEALISLGIMTVTAAIVLWLVIKVFPKGALEFQNALSLKTVFARKSR